MPNLLALLIADPAAYYAAARIAHRDAVRKHLAQTETVGDCDWYRRPLTATGGRS